jgi:hypothetical protein
MVVWPTLANISSSITISLPPLINKRGTTEHEEYNENKGKIKDENKVLMLLQCLFLLIMAYVLHRLEISTLVI